jgi:hypothetical protein
MGFLNRQTTAPGNFPMSQFSLYSLGRFLIIFGGLVIVLGIVLLLGGKIPYLGKLPGDIHIKGETFSFHFPVVTCIVLSIVLTVILNLIFRR